MQLKIKILPYKKIDELRHKSIDWKIIRDLKNENVLLVDGQISPQNQSLLISEIMKHISGSFSGIEIATLGMEKDTGLFKKIQKLLIQFIGGKKTGFTIIGPANIIKKIKKNPNELTMHIRGVSN